MHWCGLTHIKRGGAQALEILSHHPSTSRLVLGEATLDVAMGTPCGFLQELVCVRTTQALPEMTVLGQLSHRMVCTPDFEALLASKR